MAAPDWSDLQYFLAVFHAGSFHKAAAKLGIEHSTLSRRVSRLEKTLGTTLLARSARGAAFTASGKALASTLEQVALQLVAVGKEVERDALSGQVRITTAGIFANAFLADELARMHASFPRIELVLLVDTHFATLAEGNVDLAVRLLPDGRSPADPDVNAIKVGAVEFSLYASRRYLAQHPANPEDQYAGHRFIGYSDVGRDPGREWRAAHAPDLPTILRTNTVTATAAAIAGGHGLGVVPDFYVRSMPDMVCLVPGLDRSVIWLLMRPEMRRSPRVVTVHRWLAERIRSSFPIVREARSESGVR